VETAILKEKQKGRIRKHTPDDLKENRRWKALDSTVWITHVGRGYGPVPRRTTR
jgi:hypothetical protein